MGLLNTIYSAGDSAKRYVKGLLGDPVGTVQQNLLNYADQLKQFGDQNKQVLADPMGAPNSAYAGLLNAAMPAITVYHGTPHKFAPTAKNPLGEFDLGKIGTGEGAQAYGRGIYTAESPGVAGSYATNLGGRDADLINNGIKRNLAFSNGDVSKIRDSLSLEGFPSERITPEIEDAVKRVIRNTDPKDGTVNSAAMKAYDDLKRLVPDSGNLYKVDLPDEHLSRFLDWDKPLSQQTPEVKAAIDKSPYAIRDMAYDITGRSDPEGWAIARTAMNSPEFENHMRQQGLLGIRYLDRGSRGAGQGSSNFVVFDPSILNILERQ